MKDLINIGLFSILGFVFMMLGSFLAMVPVLMPAVPFAQGLLVGAVNMLYTTKIKKTFMLLIQTMLISLVYVVMGHGPWALLTGILVGLVGEKKLKSEEYRDKNKTRLAFSFAAI